MLLYIVRHAIAVPHLTPGFGEDDRPLTADGIQKMSRAARGLCALGILPEVILTSPLPRAVQTAEILRKALGTKTPLEHLEALAPAGRRQDVFRALQDRESLGSLMLVGHQPSLGDLAGVIAWGSDSCPVELKKGGACCLDLEGTRPAPRGILAWLATPAMLRAIAG